MDAIFSLTKGLPRWRSSLSQTGLSSVDVVLSPTQSAAGWTAKTQKQGLGQNQAELHSGAASFEGTVGDNNFIKRISVQVSG